MEITGRSGGFKEGLTFRAAGPSSHKKGMQAETQAASLLEGKAGLRLRSASRIMGLRNWALEYVPYFNTFFLKEPL